MDFINTLKAYTTRAAEAIINTPFEELAAAAKALIATRDAGNWIFIAGNGGSAATASHMANDFVKGLTADKDDPTIKRFKALALNDPIPVMTALANDYDYSLMYLEQLKNYSSPGDTLVVYSGSGNSPNIVRAAEWARENGVKVISFTGRDGGKIKDLSEICVIARTPSMEEIEDVHMCWEHALIAAIREADAT